MNDSSAICLGFFHDEFLEDGIGCNDPGNGDKVSSPDRHVSYSPTPEQNSSHGLTSEGLWQHVRDVPGCFINVVIVE